MREEEESIVDPVAAAITAGAAAGLTSVASQAIRGPYDALKVALLLRFPQIDVRPLEQLPRLQANQAALAEDLDRYGAARDDELVRLAQALVEVIAREAPQVASDVGVDLEGVKGQFLNIHRVEGRVLAHEVETRGGITITDVRVAGGSDPNR